MTTTSAKFSADIAADSPMWADFRMNMNVVVVLVSYPGPPRVISQMIGNELKTLITLISVATMMAGRSSGR